MKRIVLASLAFLAALTVAFAAGPSATLSWTFATTDIYGNTLAPGAILATRLVWRRHGQVAITGTLDVPSPAGTAVVAGLDCSQYDFSAQTIIVGAISDESAPPVVYDSGVVCKPNPPGTLAVH